MKYILPLLLLFFMAFSFGQTSVTLKVIGNVIDDTGLNVSNARVELLSSSQIIRTDKEGNFTLSLQTIPSVLRFSANGYLTGELKITESMIKQATNDTLFIKYQLKTKFQEIAPVEITGKRSFRAYDRPEIAIIDYDLHEKGLLLLIRENRENKLRVVDELSKTLCQTLVPKSPERLFSDCFGNRHLVYDDSVYQVVEVSGQIGLMEGISRERFNDLLEPCVVSTIENGYFRKYGLHNQSVFYSSKSKITGETYMFHESSDQEKTIAVEDQVAETQAMIALGIDPMGEINVNQLAVSRRIKENQWFYQFVLSLPLYSPLFEMNDSLFVFDHTRDSIFVYSKGNFLSRAVAINYHEQTTWDSEILLDRNTTTAYAKFISGGLVELRELDLTTGKTISSTKINAHSFPEKIKIRAGYAYYIYNERLDMSVPNIYRQRLD